MSKLTFYYGTMGSSKSAQLLISNYNHQKNNIKTFLLTPSVDTRWGSKKIKSRVGIEADADLVVLQDADLFTCIVNQIKEEGVKAVFVEEVQFLTVEQIDQLSDVVDYLDINVNCYGLKQDFQSKCFPASKRLLEISDVLVEIPHLCHCGEQSTQNMRVANGVAIKTGEQIVLGDESYISVCRKCWKQGKISSSNKL